MKTKIQEQVADSVTANVVDYFSNSINSDEFLNLHIRPLVDVPDKVEEQICTMLAEYDREYNNAPCDAEGANAEQEAELDRIIVKCANAIANVVVQNMVETKTFTAKNPTQLPPISDGFFGNFKCSDRYFGLGKTQAGDIVKTLCLYDHTYDKWRFCTTGVVELIEYYVES